MYKRQITTLFVPARRVRTSSIISIRLCLPPIFKAFASALHTPFKDAVLGVMLMYTVLEGFSRRNFSAPLVLPTPASPCSTVTQRCKMCIRDRKCSAASTCSRQS